jgi:hypothetical protein
LKILFVLTIFLISFLISPDVNISIIVSIVTILLYRIFSKSNNSFVFREWALLLYAMNYLIAPIITYSLPDYKIKYGMKILSSQYFDLAIPGFLLFALGMYSIPNKLFKTEFKNVNQVTQLNDRFLIQMTIIGLALRLGSSFIPGEIGFVFYLISMIRFVGAFSLFALSPKKYVLFAIIILMIELYFGFIAGMYHDALMWVIFFCLFYIYAAKPSISTKIIGSSILIMFILFVQAIKFAYREKTWGNQEAATLETVTEIGGQKTNSETLIGEDNLLATLNRGNQAWIFASTVDRMDRFKDFQGLENVNLYLEAALLPRLIAPNKIESGDKKIFNKFSGHTLQAGTAMGLGIFADGYIAYGAWGVYIFGFALGLIFSLTFKLVERWTKISPFYVLLLLPMLNYAVRPDCELQTTINHLAKSIVVFGALVYFTKDRFTLDSTRNQRKLLHLNLMK